MNNGERGINKANISNQTPFNHEEVGLLAERGGEKENKAMMNDMCVGVGVGACVLCCHISPFQLEATSSPAVAPSHSPLESFLFTGPATKE